MDYKFFDPETRGRLYRVPEGAMIPKNTPYGYTTQSGAFNWRTMGCTMDIEIVRGSAPHFTREPIELPKPPLPTEPGAMIRAVGSEGHGRVVMVRLSKGGWQWVDRKGYGRVSDDENIQEWESVTLVPTETWERLRVLDPEDTRDRVDAHGGVWRYGEGRNCWGREDGTFLYSLEVVDRHYGPLRFAVEVSDR